MADWRWVPTTSGFKLKHGRDQPEGSRRESQGTPRGALQRTRGDQQGGDPPSASSRGPGAAGSSLRRFSRPTKRRPPAEHPRGLMEAGRVSGVIFGRTVWQPRREAHHEAGSPIRRGSQGKSRLSNVRSRATRPPSSVQIKPLFRACAAPLREALGGGASSRRRSGGCSGWGT